MTQILFEISANIKTDQFSNFRNIFSIVFQASLLIPSKCLYSYFHFLKITTKFSQKQGKLYRKSARILLITKIS